MQRTRVRDKPRCGTFATARTNYSVHQAPDEVARFEELAAVVEQRAERVLRHTEACSAASQSWRRRSSSKHDAWLPHGARTSSADLISGALRESASAAFCLTYPAALPPARFALALGHLALDLLRFPARPGAVAPEFSFEAVDLSPRALKLPHPPERLMAPLQDAG